MALIERRATADAFLFAVAAAHLAATRYGGQRSYTGRANVEDLFRQLEGQAEEVGL